MYILFLSGQAAGNRVVAVSCPRVGSPQAEHLWWKSPWSWSAAAPGCQLFPTKLLKAILSPLDGAIATQMWTNVYFFCINAFCSQSFFFVRNVFIWWHIYIIEGSVCSVPTGCKATSSGQSETGNGKRNLINVMFDTSRQLHILWCFPYTTTYVVWCLHGMNHTEERVTLYFSNALLTSTAIN